MIFESISNLVTQAITRDSDAGSSSAKLFVSFGMLLLFIMEDRMKIIKYILKFNK